MSTASMMLPLIVELRQRIADLERESVKEKDSGVNERRDSERPGPELERDRQ
jgi:hypothetical protein